MPQKRFLLSVLLVQIFLLCGCQDSAEVKVTLYSPKYLSFAGSSTEFHNACRKVLHDLSYKEQVDDNTTRYPFYGEGASSHKVNGEIVSLERYRKTKDEAGASYKITTIELAGLPPVVQLESTAEDRNKLINALFEEFHQRGIKVTRYEP